jgi:glycerophosphoryl diester phosphodiesterase
MRDTDFFIPKRRRAMAHRGASGAWPENTMVAFRAAHHLGIRYIELDVHMTRDGRVVVHHDPDLARTAGRPEIICELGYGELAKADAGYRFVDDNGSYPFRGQDLKVPMLFEVLAAFPDIYFVIEIKQTQPSVVEPMLEAVDKAGMRRRVLVASEHQQPLDEIRALAPAIPTNFSSREVGNFFQAMVSRPDAYVPPGDALQIPIEYEKFTLVTPESVAAAHRVGVEMHVWTVNDEAEMRGLLVLGVDGIITDFPARLLKLL